MTPEEAITNLKRRLQEESKLESLNSTFYKQIIKIDNGRFKDLISSLNVKDICYNCWHCNPKINDIGSAYRCACVGHCMAITLNSSVLSYIFWKLGDITKEQHMKNLKEQKLLKVESDKDEY